MLNGNTLLPQPRQKRTRSYEGVGGVATKWTGGTEEDKLKVDAGLKEEENADVEDSEGTVNMKYEKMKVKAMEEDKCQGMDEDMEGEVMEGRGTKDMDEEPE